MKLLTVIVGVVSVLGAQTASRACLNDIDSDTLANQAKGLPDVVRVITGRFERNPPLFYQMRVARVQNELKANPSRLPLYDDIAVALDRLGRDDEAIAWMKWKKAQLDKANRSNGAARKEVKEQLYRYYANQGTFIAHRWLRAGASRAKLAEMKQARDYIAEAIRLKPNAHFGLEKYQLMAMEWILAPHGSAVEKSGYHDNFSLSSYLWYEFDDPASGTYYKRADRTTYQPPDKRKVEGLSGLIVLGNAWESIDIFDALAQALDTLEIKSRNGQGFTVNKAVTLQCLANLRIQELIKKGRRPLFATTATQEKLLLQWGRCNGLYRENAQAVESLYHRLRQEAEEWQTRRTAFMTARLKTGRHPDTDPKFWNGWIDNAPPSLETREHWITYSDLERENNKLVKQRVFWLKAFVGGALLLLTALITLLVLRRKRRIRTN
ncbi:MAG TPA: hypothetical protein VF719_06140 [Abditibacteriaceae bacterium]|jgi:hypothetical protein